MRQKAKFILAAAAVPALGLTWYLFRPELLFVNRSVDEKLPSASGRQASKLGSGTFESYAHETTGMAELVQLDGAAILRLSNFKTSNGPDVHVVLSRSSSPQNIDYKNAIDLGVIKGNLGDQNYLLPAGTDLKQNRSVTIWCKRFNVSFGGALLKDTVPPRQEAMSAIDPAQSGWATASFQPQGEIRVTSGALLGGGTAGLYESQGGRFLRISGLQPKGARSGDVYLVKTETLPKHWSLESLTKVKLGSWSSSRKREEFKVSKDIDAWLYRSVIVWDPASRKPISTAALRSDQEKPQTPNLL